MTLPAMAYAVAITLIITASATATWQIQDWRYGQQLQTIARRQADTLAKQANTALDQQRKSQQQRLQLERQIQAQDDIHYKELTDANTRQARLRDRLATADLRLSVLLNTTPNQPAGVPTTPRTPELAHAAPRAELDPAHAQRIIGITEDGDRGLRALAACQAYVRAIGGGG
ncbi:putative uncharacterized protein [Pseudomonas sp. StFLB209]|uniref:lysis system i-spanin subunit Rz n=1 Tax=Pseudomonas sp. StFLB209 TaxID=1028989 RepID=UPI0004F6410E|nr:lysis system i-spanin subunit Rz [Pseudomonas sp. StFLB209]BAP44782.1 putative uncharacterized protein [Pseudomonas sp. StFLB209]